MNWKHWLTLSFTMMVLLGIAFYITFQVINNSPELSCHEWMYDYHHRGRYNYDVLCGTEWMITDEGTVVPLPEHLEKLKPDINNQYQILMDKLKLKDSLNSQ